VSDPFDAAAVHDRDERATEFGRIVAFSDGIFAIAITLLVLNIELPESLPPGGSLWTVLWHQIGDLIAYALSFAVVGRLWLVHHRFFAGLAKFDSRLMVMNLVYLAFIVLVPFTSEALGDYGESSAGVVIYALDLAAVTAVGVVQVRYAFDAGLVRPEYQAHRSSYAGAQSMITPAIFLASIPVAVVSPLAAASMWAAIFLTRTEFGRRSAMLVRRRS
jgi:uncharacterized membrane protein